MYQVSASLHLPYCRRYFVRATLPCLAPVYFALSLHFPSVAMGVDDDPFLSVSQISWMNFRVTVYNSDVIPLIVACIACIVHEDVRLYPGCRRYQPIWCRACTSQLPSPENKWIEKLSNSARRLHGGKIRPFRRQTTVAPEAPNIKTSSSISESLEDTIQLFAKSIVFDDT